MSRAVSVVLPAVVALGVIPLLGGCGSKPPIIQVDGMTVERRDEAMALVRFDVVLENPNDRELVLETFDYGVGSGFRAERRALLTLPPGAIVPTTLPGVVPVDALLEPLPISGRLFWFSREDLESAFYLAGIIRPRTAFSGSGVADAPGAGTPLSPTQFPGARSTTDASSEAR